MKYEYHKSVPRNLRGNLLFRQKLLRLCREKPDYRSAVKRMCERDPFFYINVFGWQYNPNAVSTEYSGGSMSLKIGPFITWEYQEEAFEELLDCIARRRDVVIEKSREMGASWLCLWVIEWMWRFTPMSSFLLVSRNAKAVDDASSNSLMKKFDFMHDHMPEWLLPKVDRVKFFMKNEDNGSEITGEASTGKAGIGGRGTAIFVDEFSQIDEDREILNRTASTSGCRIFNGTHKGTGTALYDLTNPSGATKTFIKKIQMHWSKHPDKSKGLYHFDRASQQVVPLDKDYNYPEDFEFVTDGTPTGGPFPGLRSPWYDMMCTKMDSAREVAMDLDIDAKGSVEQVFDALMIRALKQRCQPPRWEGDIIVDDVGKAQLIERAGGPLRLWCQLDRNGLPPKGVYGFGCDLSTGFGATNSCVSGANARTGEKVLEYTNASIEPTPLAALVVPVCRMFADEGGEPALLSWETPGPGLIFGKRVIESGFRRVYYRTTEHSLNKVVSETPGWNNQPDNMYSLISEYSQALRTYRFVNRCEAALEEALSFKFKADGYMEHSGASNSKEYSGARVNHGDRVIADALAYKMVKQLNVMAEKVEERVDGPPRLNSLANRRLMAERAASEQEAWA